MKKNVLALSIAALVAGFAGSAHAVKPAAGAVDAGGADATALQFGNTGTGHMLVVPYFSTQNGNSTLLSIINTDDTKAIADTILIYPDAATATATLRQASTAVSTIVTGGTPQPFPVGSNGTIVTGTSPDGAKAVTLLMFTKDRALVRLEFDSAPGEPTSPQVVTSVGNMQEIALRVGLPAV